MKTANSAPLQSSMNERSFYGKFDLDEARQQPPHKEPVAHQRQALVALDRWYDAKPQPDAGGVLALPTGAGKTFTALRFACVRPLSDGYKMLWLAHTQNLLEQAFHAFQQEVGRISEPRQSLAVRVVSGAATHHRLAEVTSDDDVIIGTVQTIGNALSNQADPLEAFLASAQGRLFVVIDEGHHAPAPVYRKLVSSLRERFPSMYLLGLTATPTYTDEAKRGWLKRVFPQGIIHQETAQQLMATGILARPIIEEQQTEYTPTFGEHDYQRWVGTHQDLPEQVITDLATNRDRNAHIAAHYADNRGKYKKTIIFADRWYQCEQLSEALRARGVKTGTVYSHVDADHGASEAVRRRGQNENAQALEQFRKGELDVLLNVRILTEGTDVPDVQSVFLTRGTTSQILLTQMVGRALRGPKFGGTDEAYIVSFIDKWKHLVNWAEFDPLAEGEVGDGVNRCGKRPPVALISVDLVRQLTKQMNSGINVSPGPYTTLLPVGWYRADYDTQVGGTDSLESVSELVLVFEDEVRCFERFLAYLAGHCPDGLEDENLKLDAVRDLVLDWRGEFFADAGGRLGTSLDAGLFKLARHVAQTGTVPHFFPFEERDQHDLDALAREFIKRDMGRRAEDEALRFEYGRTDRLWSAIYRGYDLFKTQYDACVNFILGAIVVDGSWVDVPAGHPVTVLPQLRLNRAPVIRGLLPPSTVEGGGPAPVVQEDMAA